MKRIRDSHMSRRASERYGLELDGEEYRQLCARIGFHALTPEDEGCVLLSYHRNRCVYAVWMKGEWVPLVFDHESAVIVTVLPPGHLAEHRRLLPW